MTRRSRHFPFYVALLAAAAACLSAIWFSPLLVSIIASNAFFATYLALMLLRLAKLPATMLRRQAAGSDVPMAVIFLITLAAVGAALSALFIVLNARNAPGGWALALSFCAVPLGWLTIHMMAAVHYAHLYWEGDGKGKPARGLVFPETGSPGGIEFVYFSFVIGMTAQT